MCFGDLQHETKGSVEFSETSTYFFFATNCGGDMSLSFLPIFRRPLFWKNSTRLHRGFFCELEDGFRVVGIVVKIKQAGKITASSSFFGCFVVYSVLLGNKVMFPYSVRGCSVTLRENKILGQ